MSEPTRLVIEATLATLLVACTSAPAFAAALSPQEAEEVTGIATAEAGKEYVADTVLVTLRPDTTISELEQLVWSSPSLANMSIDQQGLMTCHIEDDAIVDDCGLDPVVCLAVAGDATVAQAVAEISDAPCVTSAAPDSYLSPEDDEEPATGVPALLARLGTASLLPQETTVNDPIASDQWSIAATKLARAWDLSRCDGSGSAAVADTNVTVAVIDSGCAAEHEDIKDRLIEGYDVYKNNPGIYDTSAKGHGTHVCGIAVGTANNGVGIAGASYNANLAAYKITDDTGAKGSVGRMATALNRVLEDAQGDNNLNVRVINISMGITSESPVNPDTATSDDKVLYERITALRQTGVLTVTSAGNATSSNPAPFYHEPSDYDDTLSVINVKKSGSTFVRASSSNYNTSDTSADTPNQTKDISAPGTGIMSLSNAPWRSPQEEGLYVSKDGTSMASPLVAGIAALCFAEDPTLTPAQVQTLLENTAVDLGTSGWDREYGHGMVDAYAAVSHIMGNVTVADMPDQDFTGTPVEPALSLTNASGTSLVEGTDYTVSFKDNDKLGTATATITGMGDYVGTTSAQFQLTHDSPIADATSTYDGKPHTIQVVSDADTLRYSSDGGQTFTLTEPPTITNSGSREIVCQASRDDAIIGTFRATVTVTDAPLTIRLVAADKTYDGTTSDPGARIEVEGAIPGETPAFETNASFANKNVGEHAVTAGAVKVQDGNPYNANYAVRASYLTATARIHPRPIILTSASASKAYDGKPLTAQRVDVGGSGWGAGDGATYSFIGSQTAVGSSANTFIYAITPASSAGNYTVTTATGTLTVTPAQQASMYRLYNPNSGEHFYTASRGERDALVAVGWTYEGHGWSAPTTGSPVYRLYNANAGDHHYTVSRGERDALVAVGWTYEGVGWNSGGTRPLWRQYNPNAVAGSHNYTQSASERQALVALGWKDEGIAWYGL